MHLKFDVDCFEEIFFLFIGKEILQNIRRLISGAFLKLYVSVKRLTRQMLSQSTDARIQVHSMFEYLPHLRGIFVLSNASLFRHKGISKVNNTINVAYRLHSCRLQSEDQTGSNWITPKTRKTNTRCLLLSVQHTELSSAKRLSGN